MTLCFLSEIHPVLLTLYWSLLVVPRADKVVDAISYWFIKILEKD